MLVSHMVSRHHCKRPWHDQVLPHCGMISVVRDEYGGRQFHISNSLVDVVHDKVLRSLPVFH